MKCETACCETETSDKACCGNGCCGNEGRRFLTTEEKLQRLTEYKQWLENETKGVNETITKLKKAV